MKNAGKLCCLAHFTLVMLLIRERISMFHHESEQERERVLDVCLITAIEEREEIKYRFLPYDA